MQFKQLEIEIYQKERDSLVGKKVIKVDYGKSGEEGLFITFDNGIVLEITDGEYGCDCSEIKKAKMKEIQKFEDAR